MNKAVVLALVLMGSTAMACPNLAGKYMCPDDDGVKQEMAVSQTVENGVTTYTMVDSETVTLVADGKAKVTESVEDGMKTVATQVYTCVGEKLNWKENILVTVADSSEVLANIDLQVDVSKATNGDLLAVGKVDTDVNGEKSSDQINQTCTLQQ